MTVKGYLTPFHMFILGNKMGKFSLYLSFVLQLCGGFILSAIRCYTLMIRTCLYEICKLVLYKMISCFAQVSKNYYQRKLGVLKEGNMVRMFKWAWTYNILCIWFFRIIPRHFPLKSQKRGQGHKSICFLYQKNGKNSAMYHFCYRMYKILASGNYKKTLKAFKIGYLW